MGTWLNSDLLYLKFGTDRTETNKAGEFVTVGDIREVFVDITLADLTETETVQSDTTFIPAGVRILEVQLVTHTAAATGTAIDVGMIRTDRSTEIDYNGLINAEVTADMAAAGDQVTYVVDGIGASSGGALIGTTIANKGYITASRTTATAFTAGQVRVKIRFYKP